MDNLIHERLAVIETHQQNQKEALLGQTKLLEKINSQLGHMQSDISVNSAIIQNIQNDVTENKARARFIPNIILTAVITVTISLWLGKSTSFASTDSTKPTHEVAQQTGE